MRSKRLRLLGSRRPSLRKRITLEQRMMYPSRPKEKEQEETAPHCGGLYHLPTRQVHGGFVSALKGEHRRVEK